jgi:8-oxo-dGTP pyrophosphatase MutT (NUDIX family)
MPISEYMRALREKVGPDLVIMPAATGIVLDEHERVLLVRHSNGGIWVAPGGAVDPDESPVDAAVREVWEETGIHVEPVALAGVFGGPEFRVRYTNGDEVSYVMAVFHCRPLGGELHADGEETLEARWFSRAEMAELALSRWAKLVLPHVLERGRTWIPPVRWRPPAA